jgi:TonB family protein
MIKNSLLLFLLFISCTVIAQELKTIEKRPSRNVHYSEKYTVLKSNKKIKEGFYERRRRNGSLDEVGSYKNNEKHGFWTSFGMQGIDTISAGAFRNGKKIGEWRYFNRGTLDFIFDWTSQKCVIYNWRNSSKEIQCEINGKMEIIMVDHPPLIIPEVSGNVYRKIGRNLRYPASAQDNNIQGEVILGFTVDTEGKSSKIKILKGLTDDLNKEAMKVFSEINFTWYPAYVGGESITCKYKYPINFRLK